MFRTFQASKDCYISDRVIKSQRKNNANVGKAGTLDLFKLYGATFSGSTPNNEISRILVKFDISDLRTDYTAGKIDITSPSFNVKLKLFDVYGGQPTPSNFTVKLYPLSQSFDEGNGRDVVLFRDSDVANFLTASYLNGVSNLWFASGANAKGLLSSPNIDIIASGNIGAGIENFWVTQSLVLGTEDLELDVTRIVSATLKNLIPDNGFRISFTETEENDDKTRFVKRFGSSHASDPFARPQLCVKFDDSLVSNAANMTFDTTNTLFLYNYVKGNLTNIVSGTSLTPVTGANCVLVKLVTRVSGVSGFQDFITYATGSQRTIAGSAVTGVYTASFTLASATPQYQTKLRQSGSVLFDEVWGSFDGTVAYYSGSVEMTSPAASSGPTNPKRYYVNVTNVSEEYPSDAVARMKVFFFDFSSPVVKLVRIPVETPSVIISNAYYSVRDAVSNRVVVPFDAVYNSTKLSGDSQVMFFDLWMESLFPGRSYVIDIMVAEGGQTQIYRDVCPAFRVIDV